MPHALMPALRVSIALSALALLGCAAEPVDEEPLGAAAEAVVSPTCVTLQRGVNGSMTDTMVAASKPTTTYGSNPVITAGTDQGLPRDALLSFDVSAIPQTATITSATLSLTIYKGNSAAGNVVAHRITAPWAESTVNWTTFNSAFDPTSLTSVYNGGWGATGPLSFDITPAVADWVGGTRPNYGVLLDQSGGATTWFNSAEAPTASQRPSLTVCYTTASGPPPGGESTNIVSSCALPPVPDPSTVNIATDLVYTTPGGVPYKLDVAWPLGGGVHPLVVMIHGGSWYGGYKSLHYNDILTLAGLGYTAASIDYRTSRDGYTFPSQEADTRCAVRWLRANAASFAIDPTRVAALGDSAGAHLAAQLGVQSDDPALDDGTCAVAGSPQVNYVVAYYGPYDLTTSAGMGSLLDKTTLFLNGTPESDPVKAASASPILHVDPADATFLLHVGTGDTLVPPAQSTSFLSALHAGGVNATLVSIPGGQHGYATFASGMYLPSSCTTLSFLASKLVP